MAAVRLEEVSKNYGGVCALEAIDLAVADGEFLSVIGHSGSGKSTLLRLIAGMDAPSSGRIFFGEEDVTRLPAVRLAAVAEEKVTLIDAKPRSPDGVHGNGWERGGAASQARLEATTVYVTHDHAEAMRLAHRVAVLRAGTLVQVAAPDELFRHPCNVHVAQTVGFDPMQVIDGTVRAGVAQLGELPVPLPANSPLRQFEGRPIRLGIRGSALEIAGPRRRPDLPKLRVRVARVERDARRTRIWFRVRPAGRLAGKPSGRDALDRLDAGEAAKDGGTLFTALGHSCVPVEFDDVVEVVVRHDRLYGFDPETDALVADPF